MDELKVLHDIDIALSQIKDRETQVMIINWVFEKYGAPEDVEAVEELRRRNKKRTGSKEESYEPAHEPAPKKGPRLLSFS